MYLFHKLYVCPLDFLMGESLHNVSKAAVLDIRLISVVQGLVCVQVNFTGFFRIDMHSLRLITSPILPPQVDAKHDRQGHRYSMANYNSGVGSLLIGRRVSISFITLIAGPMVTYGIVWCFRVLEKLRPDQVSNTIAYKDQCSNSRLFGEPSRVARVEGQHERKNWRDRRSQPVPS